MCDELNHNACSLAQEVELKAELEALDRETWQRRWQAEIDIQRKFAADAMKKVNELEVQLLTFEHAKQQAQADLQTEMNRCNSWQEECYKLEQYCQDWGLKHSDLWARHQELLKRLQAAEAVCEAFYSDYFEAINTVEDEEDFPDWCVAYRKWRELKTGECAIHMEKCDCKAKGE